MRHPDKNIDLLYEFVNKMAPINRWGEAVHAALDEVIMGYNKSYFLEKRLAELEEECNPPEKDWWEEQA